MAKGYMGEMRWYVSFHKKSEEQPLYLTSGWKVTSEFIDAKHFSSYENAVSAARSFKTTDNASSVKDYDCVVRSLKLEVNGFDIGTPVC